MSGSDSTYTVTFGDGASVLERVLLAIIDAHSTDEDAGSRAERLQAAMTALLGPVSPAERDLEAALMFMARQRRHAVCEAEMLALSGRGDMAPAIPTLSELAEAAAQKILQCSEADVPAAANALCRSFRQRAAHTAIDPDPICEALRTEAVERICDELAEWDIATWRSSRRQSTAV
jgi:hypothetical protein